MRFPTNGEVAAAGRHVLTALTTAATTAAMLHLISPGDATSAISAMQEVGDGLAKLAVVVGPIVVWVVGWFAARSASPVKQIAAVNEGNNGVKVVPFDSPGPMVDRPQV